MILNIRAGILFNLAADSFDRITHSTIHCILYAHRKLILMKELSYFLFLTDQYSSTDCGESYDYDSIDRLFTQHKDHILLLFIEKGYSMENVAWMASMMLFVMDQLSSDIIIVDEWRGGPTYGKQIEEYALMALREAGFEIQDIDKDKSKYVDVEYDDEVVRLHGKPDGVIVSSPGNCIKPGTLIEIKSKRQNSGYHSNSDIAQMSAYSIIYDSDVLYVKIIEDRIKCELISAKYLKDKFYDRLSYVMSNCKKIRTLIEKSEQDNDALIELINLCKRKSFSKNIH